MRFIYSILLLLFTNSIFAQDFYCFETHSKTGEMYSVEELLFTQISNNEYVLSFPEYPEEEPLTYDIIYIDNNFVILSLYGAIETTGISFNVIIDKKNLTFGTASMFNPFNLENMELSYGYCRRV